MVYALALPPPVLFRLIRQIFLLSQSLVSCLEDLMRRGNFFSKIFAKNLIFTPKCAMSILYPLWDGNQARGSRPAPEERTETEREQALCGFERERFTVHANHKGNLCSLTGRP
jgi:hypothetical protein